MRNLTRLALIALVLHAAPAVHAQTGTAMRLRYLGTSSTTAISPPATPANDTTIWTGAIPTMSVPMLYDGATLDMWPGNSTNGAKVYSGTAAGDLGKAEDAAHTSGDTGVGAMGVTKAIPVSLGGDGDYTFPLFDAVGGHWVHAMNRATAYGANATAVAAGVYGMPIADLEGRPYVNTGHPNAVSCYLATTSTSIAQITGCEVVASKSYYISSVYVSGDIANATATPWVLSSGTSTNCTGAHVLASGWHAALTGVNVRFDPPIKATVAEGLCLTDGVTGSKSITVTGFIAP